MDRLSITFCSFASSYTRKTKPKGSLSFIPEKAKTNVPSVNITGPNEIVTEGSFHNIGQS